MKMKKAIAVVLTLTMMMSFSFLSLSQPTLQKMFEGIFSVNAAALEDAIMKYAPEGTEDLALKASVIASSSYTSANGQWHLDRINDGSFTFDGGPAGFSTATDEVAYNNNMTQEEKDAAVATSKVKEFIMTFDLEGFYNVSRVALFTYGAFPDTFEIQVSEDGETYKTVASESEREGYSKEALSLDFATIKARFVRLYVTKRGRLDGNNIHFVQFNEIGIYGTPAAPTNTGLEINSYAPEHCINLAPESTVTAPGSYESGDGKWGVANINNEDTSRNSGFTIFKNNASNIDFSLGNIAEVKRVVLFPNGIAPKTFEIRTSFDGVNYKTVKTVSIPESVSQNNGNTDSENKVLEYFTFDLPEKTFASHVQVFITESFGLDDITVQCAEIAIYGVRNVFDAQLNKSSINLVLNDTLDLDWQAKRVNTNLGYDHKIEWKSNDPAIATVDENTGLVTGKSIGKTKIIATNTTIGYSAEVDVNVCEKLPYKRDNITISVFSPPTGKLFTNEHYATVAAADVDLLINSYNVTSVEDNLKMLELARNNGMNSIVADSRFWNVKENISKELAEEVYQDYKGISNLEGVYLFDEPWNGNIYAQSAINLADVMPGSFVYLNFFPGYIYNSYEQYEYTYDDLAALAEGKVDMMFDVYPFMYDGSTNYNYLFNSLEAIRQSGLKYNQNTAACMQTHGYGPANGNPSHRDPTYTDMHYQGMVYLAYGIKHLSYWKYSSSSSVGTEQHNLGAIDLDGNTTPVYDRMKAVNPIIHTVGEQIYNCDAREVYIAGPNQYGQHAVPAGFFAQPGNSNQSLLLSYLKDKTTGRNYLMVVNNDLENSVTAPINFASGIGSVELLNNDTGVWSKSTVRGAYNVTLQAGGAALIRLPESYRYGELNEAEGENVLYHKTVYGNSSLGTPGVRDEMLPGWYLSCLTDGYIDANAGLGLNGWCSELKDESFETYVKIDLGAVKTLNSLTLHAVDASTGYRNYFPKSFTVSASEDGITWKEIATKTNVSVSDYMLLEFAETDMRYLKIDVAEMNSIDGKYAAALAEIETNGKVSISRYKLVAEDANGFYVYTNCVNTEYVKTPTWTNYNDRDDIIWHDGEKGSWTISGLSYNFRTYVPVSAHNNERGTYTVHMYAYNSSGETSRGTTFDFGSDIKFDLNYGNVAKNLMSDMKNVKSGGGLTVTYDESDETITLNGTLTESFYIQDLTPVNTMFKVGDTVRVTLEAVSGTMTNGILVFEFFNDFSASPDGKRHHADMSSAGVYNIKIDTPKAANDMANYRFWVYYYAAGQYFDNFKFRIKAEVVNGGDSVYSPAGKHFGYGDKYGNLYQPVRDDAEFIGWFTEPVGGTQVTSATVNYTVATGVLYAHWKELPPEYICGLYAGITKDVLERDYLNHQNATYTYEFMNDTQTLGTGTKISVTDNTTGKVVKKYELVIFGDINSDGWYDGQDAVYVDAIISGLLTEEIIGGARMLAADCTHDGNITKHDTDILTKAGLLLNSIDQNKTIEELQTMSEWNEYVSLISQEPEIVEPEGTEPEEDKFSVVTLIMEWINFVSGILEIIWKYFVK